MHRSGGAHAGRGLSQAQPMGDCLSVKPSLLSGIESLSLPPDPDRETINQLVVRGGQITHTLTHTRTHVKTDTNT